MANVKTKFLPDGEQSFFDSVVHGLRSRGWSRIEAEGEALDRLEAQRHPVANPTLQP